MVPGGFYHHHHHHYQQSDPDPDGLGIVTPQQLQTQRQSPHHQLATHATTTRPGLPALAPAPGPAPGGPVSPTPIIPPGTSAEASPAPSQAHLRQCQWNDGIRKKYRTKLSKQFERLQALVVVPVAGGGGGGGGDREEGGSKRVDGRSTVRNGMGVNKARVLELARERIEGLVREAEELKRERERLVGMVEERGGRWVARGEVRG